MKFPKRYTRLAQNEANSLPPLPSEDVGPSRKRRRGWALYGAYAFLAILAAFSCGMFGYAVGQWRALTTTTTTKTPITQASTSKLSELHCGNSSAEARALGCVFDLLTNTWMPEYCSDPATDAEYREWVMDPTRQLGVWAFYHDDKAQNQVASEEELSNLVGSHVYTTLENHIGHCTFLARRMHRLVNGDIAAVAHNTLPHTMHCTKVILKAMANKEQSVMPQIGSTFDVAIVPCLVQGK